jgi:signal transduction histidine kinase
MESLLGSDCLEPVPFPVRRVRNARPRARKVSRIQTVEVPQFRGKRVFVEWYVDAADAQAVRQARQEFAEYARLHARHPLDLGIANVAFAELVGNVHRHVGGPAWVSLDWRGESPVLTVRDLGPGFAPEFRWLLPAADSTTGRGLYLVRQLTGEIRVETDATGARVSVTLPLQHEAAG